jgi:large conductance mechanosensitive channel
MKRILNEYKEFINKGNVVMVAVGLVMALYFKTIVDAIIVGVIMPIISAIFGKSSFEDIGFDIGDARISIGLVLQAIIVFVVVAFILFLIIKAYNRYVAKPDEKATADSELSLLTEIRDELRSR